jgi:DNA (cytosine-5)-methyltransferase 1
LNGGLEQGVQAVIGGTVAWHAEIDPGASRVLAHRHPDVPNHGDITTIDWSTVEPVDVLTGGFPCTDLSLAGLRLGLTPDTRSGLWTHMAYAIDQLRPGLVVIENVRGLLSADAHHPAHDNGGLTDDESPGDLESCGWCVGDGGHRSLRALGAVLGDLASLGFDAEWVGLRAADAGAPHGRFRVFILAWPSPDAHDLRREGERAGGARRRGYGSADLGVAAPYTAGHGRDERRTEPARLLRGPDAALSGDATADPSSAERRGAESDDLGTRPQRAAEPRERPGLRSAAKASGGYGPASRRWAAREAVVDRGGLDPVPPSPADCTCPRLWEQYAPAVHRWETILGRLAPPPTELSVRGAPRLSPRAVEFLMGLPAGWVTDVPGLGRNEMLRALGNGVVPAQCAAALRLLLPGAPAVSVEVGGAA